VAGHRAGRHEIVVPPRLRPLLVRPPDWPSGSSWRISAAACRASGVLAWAARVEPPGGEPDWIEGTSPSRPAVVQSECVDALIAALATTPAGAAVELIAPTSLRYLVEGDVFPEDAPEHALARLASQRRVWARYALGELEPPVAECLVRAYVNLAPLRWPGEAALGDSFVLYADGGCSPQACASAWVLRRGGGPVAERAWCLPFGLEVQRDGVRLAEFAAAAAGLAAVPRGAAVALVTDHADVTDFGVRGVPAFRPSPGVAPILRDLRERATARQVAWYWAARSETDGQRRCQILIDRHLRAATARQRFLGTCQAAGLGRVLAPDFDAWLAPREPLVGARAASTPPERPSRQQADEEWAASFERRERYLAADPTSPRVYVRQLRLSGGQNVSLPQAFLGSKAAGWCDVLSERPPLAGASAAFLGELRSHFHLLALLFEPDLAILVQTRPGASVDDIQDCAAHVRAAA
jgi:hypothetical protein